MLKKILVDAKICSKNKKKILILKRKTLNTLFIIEIILFLFIFLQIKKFKN